jgi:uncharacterized SAM-binding protein YcdF (DUF218 family)
MNRKRFRLGIVVAAGVLLIMAAALNPWTLRQAGRWLDVGGPPRKADAVVLLNGGINTRPFVASALVTGGWAPKILLNTMSTHLNESNHVIPHSFDINLKTLNYGGVSRDRIVLLDSAAKTTFDEAKAVADYLAEHPAKRILIVTEAPHTRRARWIFQRVLADVPVEITMVSAPTDGFDSSNWWRNEIGFLFIISEYFKLFFYGLRYGWLGCQLIAGVGLGVIIYACFYRRRQLLPSSNHSRPVGDI